MNQNPEDEIHDLRINVEQLEAEVARLTAENEMLKSETVAQLDCHDRMDEENERLTKGYCKHKADNSCYSYINAADHVYEVTEDQEQPTLPHPFAGRCLGDIEEIERLTKRVELMNKCIQPSGCGHFYSCTACPVMKEQPVPPALGYGVMTNPDTTPEYVVEPPAAPRPEWRRCTKIPLTIEYRDPVPGEIITTIEGVHITMDANHYVMRGTYGELYPITKQIFGETYEPGTAAPRPANWPEMNCEICGSYNKDCTPEPDDEGRIVPCVDWWKEPGTAAPNAPAPQFHGASPLGNTSSADVGQGKAAAGDQCEGCEHRIPPPIGDCTEHGKHGEKLGELVKCSVVNPKVKETLYKKRDDPVCDVCGGKGTVERNFHDQEVYVETCPKCPELKPKDPVCECGHLKFDHVGETKSMLAHCRKCTGFVSNHEFKANGGD